MLSKKPLQHWLSADHHNSCLLKRTQASDFDVSESASSENIGVLDASMEQLNLESALAASSHNYTNDQNNDDIDFWGEDESLNDIADNGLSHSSALNREWKRRHEQFHTMGYRDGITAGKEASAQEGFNIGFKQSVCNGYNWGLVRGVSSAYANLPDHLKEKLACTVEKRERLHNLYQSAQTISTTDALKMFHETFQHAETSQISNGDYSTCSRLDSLYKELTILLHESPEINVKIEPAQETLG